METRRDPDHFATSSPPHSTAAFVLMMYFFADAISAAIIHGRANNEVAAMFVTCVFASQAMLLVMWVGLGNAMLLVRLLCALGWCVWMTILGTPEPLRWELEFLATAGLMLLLGAAPYGLLKVLGFRIVWRRRSIEVRWRRDVLLRSAMIEARGDAPKGGDAAEPLPDPPHFQRAGVQFSIVQIFCWTALAGVAAVLVRIGGMGFEAVLPLGISVSIATALGLTILWAVLGGAEVGARMFAPFGMVVLVTIIAMGLAGPAPGEFVVFVFFALALITAAVAGVLGLFRSVGYRVLRENRAIVAIGRDAAIGSPTSATSPWDE